VVEQQDQPRTSHLTYGHLRLRCIAINSSRSASLN
jgi:hypothetical protein